MSGDPPSTQAGAAPRLDAAPGPRLPRAALWASLAGAALALVVGLILTALLRARANDPGTTLAVGVAISLLFAALVAYAIHSRISTIAVFRTQEQRLQSALAKAEVSEARARAVIDHAQDGIITIDERGVIQTFNNAASRIFGYTTAEVLGRNVRMLMHAADATAHDGYLANFLRTGMAKIIGIGREVTGRHKDGHDIPLELGVTEFTVDSGHFFCGILRDVTERKAAEQALRDSQRKLQSYIDQSIDGVLVVDGQGRYLEVNPAACALMGYDEGELLRLSIRETLYPEEDNLRAGVAHFGRVVETGRSVGEVVLRRRDGTRVVADINAVALGNDRYLGLLRDVTERFHAERMLQQERQLLESRVAERTAVLTRTNLALEQEVAERARVERELRAARELALQAAEAKAGFLANMSHELRTPMNAVIGTAALLQDTGLTAEQRSYVDMICASGDLLLAIINDILDISKIESGMLHLEVRPLEIGHVVEEAFDLLAARAADKGLDVGYAIADDVPDRVLGDATRMRQILVNLLSNAVKFTDRGEIWIAITMQARADGPPLLQVAVRDTGIGMPADRASWLFRPFTQADTSTTRKYGGTGLGLAICARLVQMMGGEIRAESEEGRGSTFVFTLPAVPVAAGGPLRYPRSVVPGLRGRRALLVTDSPVGLHSIEAPCRRWGLDVAPVGSAQEAAAALAAGAPFDVVIVDEAGHGIAAQVAQLVGDKAPLVTLSRSAASTTPGIGRRLVRPVKHSALLRVVLESLGLDPAAEPADNAIEQEGALLAKRLPLSILVAEDSRMNQKVIGLILAKLGYGCDFAENGQEVLDRLGARPYDLVFMDLQMPVMDGLEATRRIIAERPSGSRPHIVAMTAVALAGDRERCLAAGMDDYIAKPVLPASVRQAIERCGTRASSPPPQPPAVEIDMRTIAELRALDDADHPSLLRTLVADYLAEAPRHVDELRRTTTTRDAPSLAARAHKLAGMSLAIGAVEVARACVHIERLASRGEVLEAAEHIEEVAAELAAAGAELNRLIEL